MKKKLISIPSSRRITGKSSEMSHIWLNIFSDAIERNGKNEREKGKTKAIDTVDECVVLLDVRLLLFMLIVFPGLSRHTQISLHTILFGSRIL